MPRLAGNIGSGAQLYLFLEQLFQSLSGWSGVVFRAGTRALASVLPQRPRATWAWLRGCLQHHWSPHDHPPEYALVQFLVSDPLPISSEPLSRLHRKTPCQVFLARVPLQPLTSCLLRSAMPGQGRDAGVTGTICFVLSDLLFCHLHISSSPTSSMPVALLRASYSAQKELNTTLINHTVTVAQAHTSQELPQNRTRSSSWAADFLCGT